MLEKVKQWLKKKPTLEQQAIGELAGRQNLTDAHLIALARLLFIKPDVFVREANNISTNAEYILKMIEEKRSITIPKKNK